MNFYLHETLMIFVAAVVALVLLLCLITRTVHGTLLPLLAGLISAIWALGAAEIMGFHLDPLVVVVAFLITAQAISNSVQLISRFDDEIERGATSLRRQRGRVRAICSSPACLPSSPTPAACSSLRLRRFRCCRRSPTSARYGC